ncbi:hypothetical protein Ancab_004874 [Ancistrocladus abbreviatus]
MLKSFLEIVEVFETIILNTAEAEAAAPTTELLEWPQKDKRRFLHAVYRVGDLDRTIKFYTECLGMKLLRKRDIPEEKYSNAFFGFGPEESHFVVELTYMFDMNGVDKYDIGTGFGHFAIATEDVSVIQRGPTPEPLCQVMLRVGDLECSIKFYEKYTLVMMGYGPELENTILELTYNYGVAISTDDVYKSAEVVNMVSQELGGKITRQPGPIPGINTKITSFLDPDGWKTVSIAVLTSSADLHM